MKRELISELYKAPESFCDREITVCGWIRSLRDSKAFAFATINDGSCFPCLQVVLERDRIENYDELVRMNVGAAISVRGKMVLTPDAKQPFELSAIEVKEEGPSSPDYPLQKKRHTVEYLREIPHLRPRTNLLSAVFRIRSEAAYAIHSFFNENNFVYVHTPIFTTSDCEGAGEMFRVTTLDVNEPPRCEDGSVDFSKDFFGQEVSLTVSGQMEGETLAMAFGRIYTFGPTFRAENSFTARHAAEFWMIEPEFAFADLNDDMQLAWDMLQYVVRYVMKSCQKEIEFLNNFVDKGLIERLTKLVESEYKKVTYTEAVEILKASGEDFKYPVEWGCDLQTEHERYLTEKHFNAPVFVIDYPKAIKAFYMRCNDDDKTVAAMDLLVPGVGEIIGGSQREERLDILLQRMEECGLDPASYNRYLDLRKYGGAEHAGFGLGFERLIMYLTGVSNIRDVIPYPRTTGNCY